MENLGFQRKEKNSELALKKKELEIQCLQN
jgi:hypothetical protein